MAILDDFVFDYPNKIISRGPSASETIYTMNALYSYGQDTFDELTQMDDDPPMSASTPTEYQIINNWFIRDECLRYLKAGGLTSIGWDDANAAYDGNGVRILALDGLTNVDETDIGKAVAGVTSGNTGVLLDFDAVTKRLWVRPDTSTDNFANTTEDINVDGSLAGAMDGAASTTGEAVWANAYTLGTIVDNTIIYIIQDGSKLPHAWYTDDYSSDKQSGHLDAVVLIQEAGTLIDSGNLLVFARRFGTLYDHFPITITTGGRNAIPLSTSADLNNTSAEAYLFYDTEINGGFAADDVIGDAATWATVTAHAVVVSVIDWGTTGVLALKNIHGTFADNDSLFVIGSTQRGTANGTVGGVWVEYDNEAVSTFTTSDTVTSDGAGSPTFDVVGVQDDGGTGKLLFDAPTGHLYEDDGLTAAPSGTTADVDSVTENVAVRGYEADIELTQVCGDLVVGSATGTFEKYEKVTGGTSLHEAIVIYHDGATNLIVANATGQFQAAEVITGAETSYTASVTTILDETTVDSDENLNNGNGNQPYDIHIGLNKTELSAEKLPVASFYEWLKYATRRGSDYTVYDSDGTSAITETDGEQYISGHTYGTVWSPVKQSPFGTFAGGKYFGARGVWIEDMASADVQSYQLTDSLNVIQTPPNLQSFVVTTLESGWRVTVFPWDTTNSIVKTDQYTSHNTNNVVSDPDFDITVGIPSDTPAAGFILVVDDSANEKHRYRYDSWSGSTFTFPTERSGTAGAASSGDTLDDAGASFVTWGVQPGDIIRNISDGTWSYVASVTDEDTLVTEAGDISWDNLDTYEIGSLIVTYDSNDTAYVPYIYEEAVGTSVSETVIYVSNRDVIVRVRKKGIIPFEIEQTFTPTGMEQAAIKTIDTIVT